MANSKVFYLMRFSKLIVVCRVPLFLYMVTMKVKNT